MPGFSWSWLFPIQTPTASRHRGKMIIDCLIQWPPTRDQFQTGFSVDWRGMVSYAACIPRMGLRLFARTCLWHAVAQSGPRTNGQGSLEQLGRDIIFEILFSECPDPAWKFPLPTDVSPKSGWNCWDYFFFLWKDTVRFPQK